MPDALPRELLTAHARGECDYCEDELYRRADDMPEAVTTRIEVYQQQTEPLVAYYRERGNLVDIDGEGPMDEVTNALIQALEHYQPAPTRRS